MPLPIKIKFKKLDEAATIPKFATKGAACFDLHALIKEYKDWKGDPCTSKILHPHSTLIVETGLAVEIPEHYEMQLRPRSGLASNFGITIVNSPGTVDSDYRGEIKIVLHNLSNVPFLVKHNNRICQCKISSVPEIEIVEANELSTTERGEKGYGSTGL